MKYCTTGILDILKVFRKFQVNADLLTDSLTEKVVTMSSSVPTSKVDPSRDMDAKEHPSGELSNLFTTQIPFIHDIKLQVVYHVRFELTIRLELPIWKLVKLMCYIK